MPARSTASHTSTEKSEIIEAPVVPTTGQKTWQFTVKAWKWAAYGLGSLSLAFILLAAASGLLVMLFGFDSSPVQEIPMAQESQIGGSGFEKIAVIHMDGIVGAVSESLPGGTTASITASQVHQDLQQAAEDPFVKAIILRINSPGGSAVESDAIYHRIKQFREDTDKVVIASFGDVAASGGYYVALPADKIVANAASLTGSIGVILEYYDATGLMQKIGVSSEVIKSGQYKDIGSSSRPTTVGERNILQSVVDDSFNQFVQRVVEGRDMDEAKVRELADGRIYTGGQAKEVGLVDELGNLDTAVDVAKDEAGLDSATIIEYQHGGLFESLLGAIGQTNPLTALNRVVPVQTSTLMYKWQP